MPVDTLLAPIAPPLEFAYLAAGLRCGANLRVIDAYALSFSQRQLTELVSEIDPSAVVVTTTPSLLYWRCPPMSVDAPRLAIDAIRQASEAPVTVIGPHGTATPQWALARTGADWCFRGAFERELAGFLISGEYGSSAHIASRANANTTVEILNAADLPIGDFEWIDPAAPYEPHMWCVTDGEMKLAASVTKGAMLEASRGCPWSCAYCAKAPVRDKFGRRPVEVVKAELKSLRKLGFDYVYFIDETFNLGGSEFDQLLDVLAASGLAFGFQGRPDAIDEKVAIRLREAGCLYAELGIDTVSDILSAHIGRRQRLDTAQRGVEACRTHLPIVRFNRLNMSTRDYARFLGANHDDWEYPADPAFPYPGASLGDLVMRQYDRYSFDWDLAQRYSWWLRIEVYLQRNYPDLPGEVIGELQQGFLNLPETSARMLASALNELVQTPSDFLNANKIVLRKGSSVRTRNTSPQ